MIKPYKGNWDRLSEEDRLAALNNLEREVLTEDFSDSRFADRVTEEEEE
jgi:hypothetical protein